MTGELQQRGNTGCLHAIQGLEEAMQMSSGKTLLRRSPTRPKWRHSIKLRTKPHSCHAC